MAVSRDVWRVTRAGSLDRLGLEREALAAPSTGEVTVRVHAAGLNMADVFACLGMYSATPVGSFVPGLEVAGVVEAVGGFVEGRGTATLRPGDRVVALTRFGGFATALNADARFVRPLPEAWSFAEGAAFPVQAVTAWYALHALGRFERGESVLVHSAAGGVGLHALRLLHAGGGLVVATVGSDAKRAFLIERCGLRPEQVVVRDRRRFGGQLDGALASLGLRGLDVVLDGVAGPFLMPAYKRLRPEGRLIVFGASDMMPPGRRANRLWLLPRYLRRPRLDPVRMITSNRSVAGFNLIWLWERVDRLSALYDEVAAALPDPPLVGRCFPFGDAPAALAWMKSGASVGKVVLEVA